MAAMLQQVARWLFRALIALLCIATGLMLAWLVHQALEMLHKHSLLLMR